MCNMHKTYDVSLLHPGIIRFYRACAFYGMGQFLWSRALNIGLDSFYGMRKANVGERSASKPMLQTVGGGGPRSEPSKNR